LEAVDECHDVAPVDAKASGDVLLAGWPVLVEATQDVVLVLVQTDRGELVGALLAGQGDQLRHREAGAVP
jgi:hypothetical protein